MSAFRTVVVPFSEQAAPGGVAQRRFLTHWFLPELVPAKRRMRMWYY
ncbi:MAG TPA: hypothetical protein VFT96_11705 [Gemmatimonadaceae bacterium]|nr:hypothetical protein [Gemmatimonadaceae bacterium]